MSVSREFNESDPGGHLPKYVGKRQEGGGVGLGAEPEEPREQAHFVSWRQEQGATKPASDYSEVFNLHRIAREPGVGLFPRELAPVSGQLRDELETKGFQGFEAGGGVGLGARPRLQMGGMPTAADMPFWTRAEARSIEDQPHGGGLIASSGAGRTDQLPLAVPVESHVIPAQEIAGLGQGNSMSGSRIMSTALSIGPWGIQPLRGVRGHGVPMPAPPRPTRFDAGGELDEGGARHETSILAAGGEWIVPREDFLMRDEHGQLILHAGVRTVGEGDIAKGHERLNQMIKNIRNHTIKFLRSAPPPKS